MIFPELKPVQRYESQPLYLGDQRVRKIWAERKPLIEIEIVREIDGERQRIKRQGILNRANGHTIYVGAFCYHIDEILAYRLVKD